MAHAINTLENTLRRIVLVMAVAALLFPIAAWADTVVLDDGTLTLTVQQGVTSRQNLTASGPGFSAFGSGHLGFVASGCAPCPPGSVYSPGAGGIGAESGFVTYGGVGYNVSEVGAVCTPLIPGNTALLSWNARGGSGILLPPLAATFSATAPFTISVQASLLDCPSNSRQAVNATGQGTATFSFVPDPPGLGWWLSSGVFDIQPIPEPSTWLLVPTAVGLVWLAHKKRKATSFTRLGKNVIWLLRHGNSLGRWAMLLTYLRIELTRAFIVHGLSRKLSSEMVWGQRLSFPSYDVFATLFEELYLPDAYFFRSANSQPHIIDCGANIGAATAYFLTRHPDASITAFEPDETTFRILERNANQNGWKHVTLHQAALHRTEERMTFFSRPTAPLASGFRKNISSSEARATELQTVRLSSYITRPVDLLKLDVEGAELGVLEDLVESGKLPLVDQIIMEYHHHIEPDEDRLGRFLSLLEQNGFGYELRAPLDLPFHRERQHNFMLYAYRKAFRNVRLQGSASCPNALSSPVTVAPACVRSKRAVIRRTTCKRMALPGEHHPRARRQRFGDWKRNSQRFGERRKAEGGQTR